MPAGAQHVHDQLRLEESHAVEQVGRMAEVRRGQRARGRLPDREDDRFVERAQRRRHERGKRRRWQLRDDSEQRARLHGLKRRLVGPLL